MIRVGRIALVRLVLPALLALACAEAADALYGATSLSQQVYLHGGPIQAAMPVRYGFRRLLSDLWWSGVQLSPLAVVEAHRHYCDTLDDARNATIPFVLQLHRDIASGVPLGLAKDDQTRLSSHQARMAAIAERAELQLFGELIAAAGKDDAALQALLRLQSRRKLEALVERTQRRASIMEHFGLLPRDVGAMLRALAERRDLSVEARQAFLAALDRHAAAREQAWQAADSAVGAAAKLTLDLQQHLVEIGLTDPMGAQLVPVDSPQRARVLLAEWEASQDVLAALPARDRARLCREATWVLFPACNQTQIQIAFPKAGMRWVHDIRDLARALISMGQWDKERRAAIRGICADWIAHDDTLYAAAISAELRRLASLPSVPAERYKSPTPEERSEPLESTSQKRQELARAKLAELAAATGVDWLRENGTMPVQNDAPAQPDAADEELFGAADPAFVPSRSEALNRARYDNEAFVPIPWREDERADLIRRLRLGEQEATVAALVLADADAAWEARIVPRVRTLVAVAQERMRSGRVAGSDRDAAVKEVLGRQPDRRAAWDEADAIDSAMVRALQQALATSAPEGRTLLCVAALARTEELLLVSPLASRMVFPSNSAVGFLRCAMEIRGTTAERNALLGALCEHAEEIRTAMLAWRNNLLDLAEALEMQDAQLPDRMGDGSPTEKMLREVAASRAMGIRIEELAIQCRQQVRAAQQQLMASIGAQLPAALLERWQRSMRLLGAIPDRALGDDRRIDLEVALSRMPEAPALLQLMSEQTTTILDARDLWADTLLQDFERRAGPLVEGPSNNNRIAAYERAAQVRELLVSGCEDRVDHALYRVAHALPPEVAAQLPALRPYLQR